MKLEDVWSCDRNGEDDRFAEYDALDNRKLLWHGTNVAVVVSTFNLYATSTHPNSSSSVRVVSWCSCTSDSNPEQPTFHPTK